MRRTWAALLLAGSLVGAAVTWNLVFDAHIDAGARAYLERQEAFMAGRARRADMGAMMGEAQSSGVRAASLYSAIWLVPAGAALALGRHRRTPQP